MKTITSTSFHLIMHNRHKKFESNVLTYCPNVWVWHTIGVHAHKHDLFVWKILISSSETLTWNPEEVYIELICVHSSLFLTWEFSEFPEFRKISNKYFHINPSAIVRVTLLCGWRFKPAKISLCISYWWSIYSWLSSNSEADEDAIPNC